MDFALHHSFFVLQVALRLAWHNVRFRVFVRSCKNSFFLTSVCGVAATYFFLILSFVLLCVLRNLSCFKLPLDRFPWTRCICPGRLRCRTWPDDKKLAGQLSDFRSFHAKP
jgi:hypothetical protein